MKLASLLQRNEAIERKLIETKDHIPFELFASWRDVQQEIGAYRVSQAMSALAKKYGVYILANPVNSASYAHFLRDDVQSKSFTIRQRTAREGIQNGFITEVVSGLKAKPLVFTIQGEKLFAVLRDDIAVLTSSPIFSDREITACCYQDDTFVISDIDLLFIVMKTPSDTIQDEEFGELTRAEHELILELNCHFTSDCSWSGFKLIAHGPSNRFSDSKASHIHFPISVYGSEACQSIETMEQLLQFLKGLGKQGYEIVLNPKWYL